MYKSKARELDISISSSRELRRDLEHALKDLHFIRNTGPIDYAVDFSEIYAYIFPGEISQAFRAFTGKSNQLAVTRQRLALKLLFFGQSKRQLVLLRPYAIELDSFLIRCRAVEVRQHLEFLPRILEERDALVLMPEFNQLAALCQEVRETRRQLDKEEQARITRFLEKHAIALLNFVDLEQQNPVDQVNSLLNRAHFIDLDDYLNKKVRVGLEDEAFNEIYDILFKSRSQTAHHSSNLKNESASTLDALAMVTLLRAYSHMERSRRLYLVTRSWHMFQSIQEAVRQYQWPPKGGVILRHPRVISLLQEVDHVGYEEATSTLQAKLQNVNIFLQAAEAQSKEQGRLTGHQRNFMGRIEEDLRAEDGLWGSVEEASLKKLLTNKSGQEAKNVELIFSLLVNHSELRDFIFTRLRALMEDINKQYMSLVFRMESQLHQHADLLTRHLYSDSEESQLYARIGTTQEAFPYTLVFYSTWTKRFLKRLQPEHHSVNEMLDMLEEGFKKAGYERILAMAYIMATLGQWQIAEVFTERAIAIGEKNQELVEEGHYLYALCLRKTRTSLNRYLDAISHVNQAMELLKKRETEKDFTEDPRFLKELGTQILCIHISYPKSINRVDVPEETVALECLRSAEQRAGSDNKILWQIYNIELFFLAIRKDPEDAHFKKRALKLTQDLEIVLKYEFGERSKWPITALETLMWAKWQFFQGEPKVGELDLQYIYEQVEATIHMSKKAKNASFERFNIIRRGLKK